MLGCGSVERPILIFWILIAVPTVWQCLPRGPFWRGQAHGHEITILPGICLWRLIAAPLLANPISTHVSAVAARAVRHWPISLRFKICPGHDRAGNSMTTPTHGSGIMYSFRALRSQNAPIHRSYQANSGLIFTAEFLSKRGSAFDTPKDNQRSALRQRHSVA